MAYTDIDNPELYFQCKIYTGNATDDTAITLDGDENMQPDWVWIKDRTNGNHHRIYDSVRGATKAIYSSLNYAEGTASDGLKSFNSDGFTLGDGSDENGDNANLVSWCWKAGTTGSGTSTGSGTGKAYSYSVSTDAGFSIVSFIGNGTAAHTIPHHLGVTPKVIILKARGANQNWRVFHHSLGSDKRLILDSTNASEDAGFLNDTDPTSTVFTLGASDDAWNADDATYIAYCFAEKQGYSKFESYTGNGDADGTFVYTGFSPSFVLLKETSNANNFMIFDNKRSPFNLMDDFISPDIADAESTGNANNRMDMLSNGFKIRGSGTATNRSGSNFIYMAFAENPFTTSTGVPATAR